MIKCKDFLTGGVKSDNPARKLGKFLSRLFFFSILVSSCTDDDFTDNHQPLQVSVTANSPLVSRAIVTDEYLPDGSTIGVTVTDADGNSYDNQNYSNVKYTAAGTGEAQTWTGAAAVSLSTTVGKAVAYYPWQEVADLTAVPVETETQTDYMYSKPVTGLSLASPAASFTMQHALTDIRVKVIRGDYTGEGVLESVSVKAPAFGAAATMNVHDGTLASVSGEGTEFKSEYTDKTITAEGLMQDFLVVPVVSVTSGDVSVNVNIDGKKFTAPVQFTESFMQGFTYYFDLTLNNKGLTLNKVKVEPWAVEMQTNDNLEFYDDQYIVEIQVPSDGYTYYHNINYYDVEMDWGDGTIEQVKNTSMSSSSTSAYPAHVYEKAGIYKVIATGNIRYIRSDVASKIVTNIINIGVECGVQMLFKGFDGQRKLETISKGALDGCTKVTSFQSTFYNCSALTSIPEGLFDNCTEVTNFENTFSGCSALTEIPEGLFDKCTEVTDFSGAFYGCSSLMEIPAGLFDNCTEVTEFNDIFMYCENLKTIPQGLFDNCTKVTRFGQAFRECSNLTSIPGNIFKNCSEVTSFNQVFKECTNLTEIPVGLFDSCTKVTSFSHAFERCTALQTIPEGLFDKCTKVTDFGGTFAECRSLETIPEGLFDNNTEVTHFHCTFKNTGLATIPEGLFDKCTEVIFVNELFYDTNITSIPKGLFDSFTKVKDFNQTFYYCTEVTSIPEGLFDKCTEVTSFEQTFYNCGKLQAIPEGLFDKCTEVISFQSTFAGTTYGYLKLKTIPEGLFDNCTKVTDFNSTFSNCRILQTIPEGLFDKNTEVTNFSYTFSGCTGLQSIPEGLFDKCTEVTNFSSTFNGCTFLQTIPVGLFDNNIKVKYFGKLFYNCSNLTGESPYVVIQVDGVDTKVHLYERSAYPEYFTVPASYGECFGSCNGLTDYTNIPAEWK